MHSENHVCGGSLSQQTALGLKVGVVLAAWRGAGERRLRRYAHERDTTGLLKLLQFERMRVVVVDHDDGGVTHVLRDGAALPSERAARGEVQGGQTC